ncbi:MAG TPA: hypothetical protein VG075_04450 [Candidatus Acidoferrum sp.]|jgi:hypothetical protein|nr:hypothetical protein [Candidatus Acidoferrum sp.]
MSSDNKYVGHVVAWWPERSYGFIHCFDQETGVVTKVFLHLTNIYSGVPEKGRLARFHLETRKKGHVAVSTEIFSNRQEMETADGAAVLSQAVSK